MYLLPLVLLLVAYKIEKIWDIELALIWIAAILCLSTLYAFRGPFNSVQAYIRLASILVGFSYFLIAARGFFIDRNAEWLLIVAHYPILIIGILQAISVLTGHFGEFNTTLRSLLVSNARGGGSQVALLASEPSFVAFQAPLLLYLFHKYRRFVELSIYILILIFSQSVNVYILILIFYISYFMIYVLKNGVQNVFTMFLSSGLVAGIYYSVFISDIAWRLQSITTDTSVLERFYYILSVVYMIFERPFGVGVGQYGVFAGDIFLKYGIPITRPHVVLPSLESGTLNPWSFILGLIAEGGIIVIPAIIYFFIKQYRVSKTTPVEFATFISGSFLLLQTYPPATPYVWIAFGLIWHNRVNQ